ncbi:MAG: fibrobacter succinogenes major paralogous domain-containing protein [Prevotellaceae bacterium]|nr:fibrobacter succinogenes major paralogous domain-containing protein [Prevotellaceae bacterium]
MTRLFSVANTPIPTLLRLKRVSTEIEFINLITDAAHTVTWDSDGDGVDETYYWVELDAANTYTGKGSGIAGKLRILATNLGVENENAADFGDLYQWGRIADGHQTIGWDSTETTISGTITKTIAFDAATTSSSIAKTAGTITYDSNPAAENGAPFGQIIDNDHKGKFVYGANYWYQNRAEGDYFWADNGYAKTANDPCPTGWHVPTQYEWGAIISGIANSNTGALVGGVYTTQYNTWRFSPASNATAPAGYNYHAGGVVVTAQDKSKSAFLLAVGRRYSADGTLGYTGEQGFYWSSTGFPGDSNTYRFVFDNVQLISPGYSNASNKSHGYPVRCVSELEQ